MKKYSLVVEGPYYNKLEIIFQQNNKKTTKTELLTIDAFTTSFIDKTELENFLKDRYNIIKEIDKFYIIDNNNKLLEIAYSDCSLLGELSLIDDKVNTNTKEYKKILFNFLKQIEDKEFFDYIIEKSNFQLKSNLIKRIKQGDYSNNTLDKIIESVDDYEDMRKLVLICHKYKLNKLKSHKEEIQKKYQKIVQKKTI